MRILLPLLAGALCTAWLPATLRAQEPPAAPPRVEATARVGDLRIDGHLTEEAWDAAVPVDGFVQAEPVEGAPVEQRTEVRVLYDEDAVYVAARMHDRAPESIARQLVRRDERGQFDYIEVALDSDLDRRTGYRFRVSAAGVQGDSYLYDDVREDDSWDAVWESAVAHDSLGWTAEMRIPLSQIRFRPSPQPQSWGINFTRRRVASNEVSNLSLESRRRHGRVSIFAPLTGLTLPSPVRRLEARPYLLGRTRSAPAEPRDPFFDGRESAATAGLDVRYGIASGFTLDATLNPDFGQVEVDPAVINLSAFETFYPERRPFFVEDARVFDFNLSGGNNSLFYSRRIGRSPRRGSLDGADFVDVPEQASILGAAKLTGRTDGDLAIGALVATTASEEARAYFVGGDSLAVFLAEPGGQYGVARLQQALRGGASVVGGIATALHRRLPDDGTFDFLPAQAYNAGVDFEHTWASREWALWGFFAGTHVRGSEEALIRLQSSSSHYFQRPDAVGLGVDSTATSMTGAEWRLQFERRSGQHWTGSIWAAQRSPGFDTNDLGYFRGSERLDGGARIRYQEIEPGAVLRGYQVTATTYHNWRHEALREPFSYARWGHAHKAGAISLDSELTFLNYWELNLNARYAPELLDDAATRGGPLMLRPASSHFRVRGSTDRRQELSLEPSFGVDLPRRGSASWDAGLELSYRPTPSVEIETEPSFAVQRDAAQYVTSVADPAYLPTYGSRYLFSDLERRTFSLDTRLNVTFSPSLTLQLFLQPLLSVGDYTSLKQLERAESFDFDVLEEGIPAAGRCVGGRTCVAGAQRLVDFDGDGRTELTLDRQDFRVRALRGNAVARWEYRPGSSLFLVWQQRRSFRDLEATRFDVRGEVAELLLDPPENVFIIKASYWLSL